MREDKRIINIYEYLTPSHCKEKYSKIPLQGKWLTDLGFKVGKKVYVETIKEDNKTKIVIYLVD